MHRPIVLILSLLVAPSVVAQRPDTGPEKGISRLAFEAMLLGGGPAVEQLEINGKMHDLARMRG